MASRFRIGLVLQGSSEWVGGIEYIKNIAKAVYSLPVEQRADVDIVPISATNVDPSFYNDMPPEFNAAMRCGVVAPSRSKLARRFRYLATRLFAASPSPLPEIAEEAELDFVYPFVPLPLVRGPLGGAWIPDFQHLYFPKYFSKKECRRRDWLFRMMARRSSLVVLSSRSAEEDFLKFIPAAWKKSRVLSFRTVPPNDWFDLDPMSVQQQYGLPDKFFIICNQFWQHKNHEVVFRAVGKLKRRGQSIDVVCTGNLDDNRNTNFKKQVLHMIEEENIGDRIRLLGLIPRADQIALLRRSIGVVQPSLFEGWSTVIEDARCLGKPMIVSSIPVHIEQSPTDSLFFDPHGSGPLADDLYAWWQAKIPGPDAAAEQSALAKNRIEVQRFGADFLRLARSAG